MDIYYSPQNASSLSLVLTVKTLNFPYEIHDIDADDRAKQRLNQLTHGINLPTVVFDDGAFLVQPTPEQFVSAMQAQLTSSTRGWLGQWSKGFAIIALGLGVFALTFIVAGAALTVVPQLVTAFVLLLLGFTLCGLLPLMRRVIARLRQNALWQGLRYPGLLLYCGVLGLALGARHASFEVWLWLALGVVLIVGTIAGAALTQWAWQPHVKSLQRVQMGIGLVSLIGFLLL